MPEKSNVYKPFQLFEYDHQPGEYCLMLSDRFMVEKMDLFEANGRYGNGYGWADVALHAMRSEDPDIESRLDMDPEAGTFVAFGNDYSALQKLAELLHGAYHDHGKLSDWVSKAPYEWD